MPLPAERSATDLDGDVWSTPADCDDDDPDTNPAGTEVCDDGADNDCDGLAPACGVGGDADGDGFNDLLVGGPGVGADTTGHAWILLTPVSGTISLADAQGTFIGTTTVDEAGTGLSFAGDVDGDGFYDFLVGGPGHTVGIDRAGVTWLVSWGAGF